MNFPSTPSPCLHARRHRHGNRAFSLLELLVVVVIIGILCALLIPRLEKATENARLAACGQALHQISLGIHAYAAEYNGELPLGPATPSALDPSRTWRQLGTHQLRIAAGNQPTGLGMLYPLYVKDAKGLLCPSDDTPNLPNTITSQLTSTVPADAYGSYAYRQLDQNSSDRLTTPGNNAFNQPARALAMDYQAEAPASDAGSPWRHLSHDSNEYLNSLYTDGHVQGFPSEPEDFQVRPADFAAMPGSLEKRIDQLWINADHAESGSATGAPQLP